MTESRRTASTDHLISRPAYTVPCSHCGHLVLVAIDGGWTIVAAIHPLSVNEEIAALLTGRVTYDLVRNDGDRKTWLISRDIHRIRAGRHYPVLTAHICPDNTRPVMSWLLPRDRGYKPQPARKASYDPGEKVPF